MPVKRVMMSVVAVCMIIPLALLAFHKQDPAAALLRYKTFQTSHSAFQVHFKVESGGKLGYEGDLSIKKPDYLWLKMTRGDMLYLVSDTPAGYTETEKASESYDESPPLGGLGVEPSRIAPGAAAAAPSVVANPDLTRAFGKKPDVTSSGGIDTVHVLQTSPMGNVEIWAAIDPQGELKSFHVKRTGSGSSDLTWTFSDYKFPANLSDSSFKVEIPLGYLPYALPRTSMPLQAGKVAPTSGWVKAGSDKPVDLLEVANHKPQLLVIIDSDEPSKAASKSLRALEANLPVTVIGPGGYSDPTGKLLNQFRVAGTPMFYLIDGTGKVKKLWLGYDPSDAAGFEKEVREAIK